MGLLELPEAELILPGLKDLDNGNPETVGALLIAIASTRLTEAGLNFSTRSPICFRTRASTVCTGLSHMNETMLILTAKLYLKPLKQIVQCTI
jgi:hypothetical protein